MSTNAVEVEHSTVRLRGCGGSMLGAGMRCKESRVAAVGGVVRANGEGRPRCGSEDDVLRPACELELRESRPQPSAAFESRVLEQLTIQRADCAPHMRRLVGVGWSLRSSSSRRRCSQIVRRGIGYASSSTVEVATSTVDTVTTQTTAVVKVVKRAVKPAKIDKPKIVATSPARDHTSPTR